MYLRMVHRGRLDKDSGRPEGIFTAAYALADARETSEAERAELKEALEWFERNVPARRAFGSRLPAHAIFWFKASHTAITRRAWQLVNLLRRHDLPIEMVKTDRPGQVVYEDEMQVAAIPWRETPS